MNKHCGICGIYPRWLRDRATPKNFIAVYGLLGTVQAMAFIYIVVTLTTLEKRFKIPSRTTASTKALKMPSEQFIFSPRFLVSSISGGPSVVTPSAGIKHSPSYLRSRMATHTHVPSTPTKDKPCVGVLFL